jgi:outer membrane protein insertion porin family
MKSLFFKDVQNPLWLNPFSRGTRSLLAVVSVFLMVAAGLVLAAPLSVAAAEKPNTLVLPLKINTQADVPGLTRAADGALEDALAADPARTQTFTLVPRPEAEKTFDYAVAWPPSHEALLQFGKDRAAAATYVAAGSLTRLGETISIDIKVYDMLDPSSQTYYYLDGQALDNIEQAVDRIVRDVLAYTGRTFLIASIAPEGNSRIDSGAILRSISSRAGEIYEPGRLRSDIKSVFKMGYFDDVRLQVSDTERGKALVFAVKEKPLIGQVSISGQDDLKEEDIKEVITVTANTILNPQKVREAVDNIKALYKSKGFYNTEVNPGLTYPSEGRVNVEFAIEEGEKVYIKEIRFVGNETFKESKLQKAMGTKERGWLSWITDTGVLKREILEQDAARITSFYHHHGFIEAAVGKPEVTQEGKWLYITIEISEGKRYRVGKIELTGDIIGSREELLQLLKIPDEEYLSRNILREDILRLNDHYAENGYAFAEAVPGVNASAEDRRVDITIQINKKSLVHINRIRIKGNTRTRDKVIRREIQVKEKGIFNSKALRQSHQRLQRLDFFEDVAITPEATADREMMDLTVEVKEKPTGAFSVGAGYSSVDSLLFQTEISQNNFLGRGQRLALQANISGTSARYNLGFTEPHFYDSKLLVGGDLYNWEREYDTYTRDSTGFAVRLGYPVWEEWHMVFSYGFDDTSLTDVAENADQSIKESLNVNTSSFVTLSFSRDTRNSLFATTSGSVNTLRTEYAGGPLGADSQYTKVEGSSSWFFPGPFIDETAFHFKLAGGQVWENEDDKLPDFEKFYLGGITSIRGFPSRTVAVIPEGSTDPDDKIGGQTMWYTNIEYHFPLIKDGGLRGLFFYDAGNVYDNKWDFTDIKQSVGTGVRWMSPMGPLRLEWAYVIDPLPYEDKSNWEFSIGGMF